MPPLTTDTGKIFRSVDELLEFIRECRMTMLDKNASLMESHTATVELVYAFKALDDHLSLGGVLPRAWSIPRHP